MQWFSKCLPVVIFPSFSLVLGSCHKVRTSQGLVVSLRTKFISCAQEASLLEIIMPVPTLGLDPVCGSILLRLPAVPTCSSEQQLFWDQLWRTPQPPTVPTSVSKTKYRSPFHWGSEWQVPKDQGDCCSSAPSFYRSDTKTQKEEGILAEDM